MRQRSSLRLGRRALRQPVAQVGAGAGSESTAATEFRTLNGMAMGKKPAARQPAPLWVTTADPPMSAGHPYERPNRILQDSPFDVSVEGLGAGFCAARLARPSVRPGRSWFWIWVGWRRPRAFRRRRERSWCVSGGRGRTGRRRTGNGNIGGIRARRSRG